jgi:hypothetical protein
VTANIENIKADVLCVELEDIENVASQFVAWSESPGKVHSVYLRQQGRKQGFLNARSSLQVPGHPIVDCSQVVVR